MGHYNYQTTVSHYLSASLQQSTPKDKTRACYVYDITTSLALNLFQTQNLIKYVGKIASGRLKARQDRAQCTGSARRRLHEGGGLRLLGGH